MSHSNRIPPVYYSLIGRMRPCVTLSSAYDATHGRGAATYSNVSPVMSFALNALFCYCLSAYISEVRAPIALLALPSGKAASRSPANER